MQMSYRTLFPSQNKFVFVLSWCAIRASLRNLLSKGQRIIFVGLCAIDWMTNYKWRPYPMAWLPNILLFKRRLHAGRIKIQFSQCGYRFCGIYLRNYDFTHLKFNKSNDPHNGVSIWSAAVNYSAFYTRCKFCLSL